LEPEQLSDPFRSPTELLPNSDVLSELSNPSESSDKLSNAPSNDLFTSPIAHDHLSTNSNALSELSQPSESNDDLLESVNNSQSENSSELPESQSNTTNVQKSEIESYSYLRSDLQRWFEHCEDNYHVKICAYSVNTSSSIPFLQFVAELGEDKCKFPSIEYSCVDNDDEDDDGQNTHFVNSCFEKLLALFDGDQQIHEQNINIRYMYMGFIRESDTIHAFFDCTKISSKLQDQNIWTIVDELVYKKNVLGVAVEDSIPTFFKAHPKLLQLLDHDQYRIDFPFQVYPCNMGADGYINVDEAKRVDHPIFGSFFYFSPELLDNLLEDEIYQTTDLLTSPIAASLSEDLLARSRDLFASPSENLLAGPSKNLTSSSEERQNFDLLASPSEEQQKTDIIQPQTDKLFGVKTVSGGNSPEIQLWCVKNQDSFIKLPTFGSICRYVLFPDNAEYIIKNISEVSKDILEESADIFLKAPIIYFRTTVDFEKGLLLGYTHEIGKSEQSMSEIEEPEQTGEPSQLEESKQMEEPQHAEVLNKMEEPSQLEETEQTVEPSQLETSQNGILSQMEEPEQTKMLSESSETAQTKILSQMEEPQTEAPKQMEK
jgi:hypothetical protein